MVVSPSSLSSQRSSPWKQPNFAANYYVTLPPADLPEPLLLVIGQPEDRFDDPGDAGKPDEDLDLRSHSCDVKGLDPKGLACGMPLGGVNVNILWIHDIVNIVITIHFTYLHAYTCLHTFLRFLLSYFLTSLHLPYLLTYLCTCLFTCMRTYFLFYLLCLHNLAIAAQILSFNPCSVVLCSPSHLHPSLSIIWVAF